MHLLVLESTNERVRAGYVCPCGCEPSVEYERHSPSVSQGCCCGNEFAVGPAAEVSVAPKAGFAAERETFSAPWGEGLAAAWSVGPSVHGPSDDHGDHDHGDDDPPHDHGHGEHDHGEHHHGSPPVTSAIDPVCGMTVEPEVARAKGLHSALRGTDYYFCGKGCRLEFVDDPERYLDPSYSPSM